MEFERRCWAEVDLGALRHNFKLVRERAGDAAIVFGGGAADSVDDVARMTGTINYEVLCDVGRRVQRVYVENGAEVELVDYLKGE